MTPQKSNQRAVSLVLDDMRWRKAAKAAGVSEKGLALVLKREKEKTSDIPPVHD